MRTFGSYRLGELLARGAAGSVYRATAPDGGAVALKLIHGGRALEPDERRRFAREVEAVLRLEHANLVRAHDVVWDQGRAGLVMELLEGEDQGTRIARHGPLPLREAVRIARDLARGVAHAHARGVVHRDVKPDNVLLVRSDGRAVLVDFGLARDLVSDRSHLTRTGTFHGTPGYWPPEQAMGDLARIGPASDVYALGATLYAFLTGRPPIVADSFAEALSSALTAVPPPLASLRAEVDRSLAALVHRCLAKVPEERFPTAHALAEALDEWLRAGYPAEPTRRDRKPAALAAAILFMGGIGAAGLVLRSGAQQPVGAGAGPTSASTALPGSAAVPGHDVRAVFRRIEEELQAGRMDEAEELLVGHFERDPAGSSKALVYLAALYRQTGRTDADLVALLDRAVAAHPRLLCLRARRAILLFNLGRFAAAEADAELALSGEPLRSGDREDALHARGGCRARERRSREAIADFDAALALNPGNQTCLFERAKVHGQLLDHARVVEDATRALALGLPAASVPLARGARGGALSGLGRGLEARADLEAALALLPPEHRMVAFSRELLTRLPRAPTWTPAESAAVDSALRSVDGLEVGSVLALEIVDGALARIDHPRLHDRRGTILTAMRRGDEAVAALSRALELDPANGHTWLRRGAARFLLGQREEAAADLWRGLSIDPREKRGWEMLAQTLRELKQPLGAMAALKQLLTLDPSAANLRRRAELHLELGDPEAALADLERAVALLPSDHPERARALRRMAELQDR